MLAKFNNGNLTAYVRYSPMAKRCGIPPVSYTPQRKPPDLVDQTAWEGVLRAEEAVTYLGAWLSYDSSSAA